jgi:hypothetical protein
MSAVEPPRQRHLLRECCPSPPGAEFLAAAIHEGADAGLPVWYVPIRGGYLPVPRLAVLPVERRGRTVLRPVGEVAFHREVKARGGRIALDSGVLALLGGKPLLAPLVLPPPVLHALSAPTPQEAVAVARLPYTIWEDCLSRRWRKSSSSQAPTLGGRLAATSQTGERCGGRSPEPGRGGCCPSACRAHGDTSPP